MKLVFGRIREWLLKSRKQKVGFTAFCITFLAVTSISYANIATKLTSNIRHDSNALLSVDDRSAHLIYQQSLDWSDNKGNVFYRKKGLTDQKWSAPVKIANGVESYNYNSGYWGYGGYQSAEANMSITSYRGNAYVAYMINDGDQEIVLKSNKSGSWPAKPRKLTNNTGLHDFQPSITQYKGRLYVVFVRRKNKTFNNSEIYFTKNVSGGWTKPIPLTANSINDSDPDIYAKGGKLYVVWLSSGYTKSGWKSEIKYRYFYKGKWSGEHTVVSAVNEDFSNPSITVGSKTYIAYTKTYDWYSVNVGLSYYDSGAWKKVSLTSNASSDSANHSPRMASFGNKVGIIWSKTTRGQSSDLWFAYKDSASSSWKRTNLSNTSAINELSNDIAIDASGKSHITYSGDEDGDSDIYYLNK